MPTPHPTPLTLAVIVASTRAGRFGPTVADWFLDHVRTRPELSPVVVDVAAADLPHTFGAPAPALADIGATLAAADAFVVVTPEYNHSYPGGLKNLIDLHSAHWRAKPVAFVSYGGRSGGLRAVEHLRAVFAELHTVTVRDTVSFHDPWTARDDTGALQAGEGAELAAKTLLDQLVWWAEALRAARATRPYVA